MNQNLFSKFLIGLFLCIFLAGTASAATKVTIWGYGGSDLLEFFNEKIEEFEKDNQDLDVEYVNYAQKQYSQSLPLALQSGSGPDILALLPEMEPRNYIQNGWLLPLDGYVSKSYLKQFDPRILVEGVTYFNGKLYSLIELNRFSYLNGMMYYNKTVFKEAGLSEKDLPITFSEFRSVLKKITDAGKGDYFGLGLGANPSAELSRILNGLYTTAAPASGDVRYGWVGFDYKTGKFSGHNKNHQEVVQLLIDVVKDGSMIPGWTSMAKADARNLFAQNRFAFYFDGPWMPRIWENAGYTDLDFGVAEVPVPDSGRRTYRLMGLPRGGWSVNGNVKDVSRTVRVFKWWLGKEMQEERFKKFGTFPSITTIDVNSRGNWFQKRQLEITKMNTRSHPEPSIRNPAAAKVKRPNVKPTLFDLTAAAMEKQDIDYYSAEAERWSRLSQQELNRNIKKATDEGSMVSIKDFIFPDWNPLDNYDNKKK